VERHYHTNELASYINDWFAFLMPPDETFDVGVDTRTGVDDNDYQVPFRFTGKLAKLTFNLGSEQLTAEDRKVISERLAQARD
jgi:hypothetical protein